MGNDPILPVSQTRVRTSTLWSPLIGTAGRNRTPISSFVARGILHYTTAVIWWRWTGSNRRHLACKANALPTELHPQFGGPKGNRTPADGVTSRYTYRYTMGPNLVETTGVEPVVPFGRRIYSPLGLPIFLHLQNTL